MITAIWAQDKNGLIGKDEVMPWYLPNDLKFFRTMTETNTIVMGRKTFEGMGKRILPNRQTIVLTTDLEYEQNDVLVMHSVSEVLAYDEQNEGITFIAGGAKVYEEFLPHTQTLYKTMILAEFEGDTFFPALNWEEWSLIDISVGETNDRNRYDHQFEIYQRKTK